MFFFREPTKRLKETLANHAGNLQQTRETFQKLRKYYRPGETTVKMLVTKYKQLRPENTLSDEEITVKLNS